MAARYWSAKYVSITDKEVLSVQPCCATKGSFPRWNLASLGHVMKIAPTLPSDHIICMNMCGRGDKDIFTVARHLGFDMTAPGRDAGCGHGPVPDHFNVVAPVFLIAGSGYLWVKRVEYPTEFVTRFMSNIAIPCLVFDSLVTTASTPTLATMFWASLATYGGAMVAVYFCQTGPLGHAQLFCAVRQ